MRQRREVKHGMRSRRLVHSQRQRSLRHVEVCNDSVKQSLCQEGI